MKRSILTAAALLGTLAVATPAEAAGPGCRLSYLPLPDRAVSAGIAGGDATGRYAVGSALVDRDTFTERVSVIWRDGAPSVPSLPFGTGGLVDINANGLAVGTGYGMAGDANPVTWSAAAGLDVLPVPHEGWEAEATAVNSRGDVVGTAFDPAVYESRVAVLWPAAAPGTVQKIPGGGTSFGVDIDEDGTVLAQTGTWVASGPAVVWRTDGGVVSLGEGSVVTAARGGWATGWRNGTDGSPTVRWNLRTGKATEVRNIAFAYAVDRDGDVAGEGPGAVLVRRDGSVLKPEVPAGAGSGVRVLGDRGIAYGHVNGAAARWRGCF